jgi:hypothetical protein
MWDLRFSRWCGWCSSGFCRRIGSSVDAKLSEKHTASIFRAETLASTGESTRRQNPEQYHQFLKCFSQDSGNVFPISAFPPPPFIFSKFCLRLYLFFPHISFLSRLLCIKAADNHAVASYWQEPTLMPHSESLVVLNIWYRPVLCALPRRIIMVRNTTQQRCNENL